MSDDLKDDDAYRAAVKSAIADAADYIDTAIAPNRAKATAYYRGDPFGNEEEGRSQIVMTVLRDKVQAMKPSLLRIFTSSNDIVEYAPRTEATVELAAQQTDYINYVFYNDNPGFQILNDWIDDALLQKIGVVQWRWAEEDSVSESSFTGLFKEEVSVLEETEGVEILEMTPGDPVEQPSPDGVTVLPDVPAFDVRIRRTVTQGRAVVECVPPEEFLIARDATDVETASLVGRRMNITVSKLVEMGYDRDEIEENAGGGDAAFDMNNERTARNPFNSTMQNPDPSMKTVLYTDVHIRVDRDGDGIAELRRVCTLGNGHYILHDEIAPDVPMAAICPDPRPHVFFGQSVADQLMDLQLITSNITRNTLDSLAQSIHPRTAVVEGQVNLDDVMNNEVGGIIRQRAPGMVTPFATPFVGQAAMPILAWVEDIAAKRTGVTAASQGLDPDVLQSTTAKAVSATVQGAQERTEMIARFIAELGLKRLFKGLLRLVCRHQDKERTVKLRGKWVPVNPKDWDADLDVQVNVALGRGTDQDKILQLGAIKQAQSEIIAQLGPTNPIAGVSEYVHTLTRATALMGFKDTSQFFKTPTPEMLQQMAQSKAPPPDPNMMLVQIEQQKVAAKIANDQGELALKEREMQMVDARERENNRLDFMAKIADIEAKYSTDIDIAALEAETDGRARQHEATIAGQTERHNALVQALATPQAPQ